MVVLRMLAQNSDQDQRSGLVGVQEPRPLLSDQRSMVQDQRSMVQDQRSMGPDQRPMHPEPRHTVPTESRESLKLRTLQVSRVVVNAKESYQIVEELLRVGDPVGLDGEGVNLGPKGERFLAYFK